MSNNKHKYANTKSKAKRKKKAKPLTAKTADRHQLYEDSVQAVDAEIDFVDSTISVALATRRANGSVDAAITTPSVSISTKT
jgi:hypothetical protein